MERNPRFISPSYVETLDFSFQSLQDQEVCSISYLKSDVVRGFPSEKSSCSIGTCCLGFVVGFFNKSH